MTINTESTLEALDLFTIDNIDSSEEASNELAEAEQHYKILKKHCEDLETLAKELKEQEDEVDKFGSATDQARSHYYSTR